MSASGELPDLTRDCIEILFHPEDRERARAVLLGDWGHAARELERCRIAALKLSDGDLARLEQAVRLGRRDYRDLLVAAGFGNSTSAHLQWRPKPAAEPSEIEPARLAEGIHTRVGKLLSTIGFERHEDEWRRSLELEQSLRLITGLTTRVEVRFFLRLMLEAKPLPLMLQLPRLPWGTAKMGAEQGYIFRSGDQEAAFYETVDRDIAREAKPWFERFTTSSEVERGFKDGSFKASLKTEDVVILF